jgi:hypothetical protein
MYPYIENPAVARAEMQNEADWAYTYAKEAREEADIAWMRRMNAVEAEQAARDAEAAKEFEEADRSDWHPPYEPIGD